MSNTSYRIKIVNGDKQFEVEGNQAFVLKMMKQFGVDDLNLAKAASRPEQKPIPTTDKSISVGEFIKFVGFKRHMDLVLAFAYYQETYDKVREFRASDINKLYYEAKIDSSNTSRAIISNIKRGFMMEARDQKSKAKKRYTVTKSGEDFIEKKLAEQS